MRAQNAGASAARQLVSLVFETLVEELDEAVEVYGFLHHIIAFAQDLGVDVFVHLGGRHDDHGLQVSVLLDFLPDVEQSLDPVHDRHLDVKKYQINLGGRVRLILVQDFYRALPVFSFKHVRLEILNLLYQQFQPQNVILHIVHDQDLQRLLVWRLLLNAARVGVVFLGVAGVAAVFRVNLAGQVLLYVDLLGVLDALNVILFRIPTLLNDQIARLVLVEHVFLNLNGPDVVPVFSFAQLFELAADRRHRAQALLEVRRNVLHEPRHIPVNLKRELGSMPLLGVHMYVCLGAGLCVDQ